MFFYNVLPEYPTTAFEASQYQLALRYPATGTFKIVIVITGLEEIAITNTYDGDNTEATASLAHCIKWLATVLKDRIEFVDLSKMLTDLEKIRNIKQPVRHTAKYIRDESLKASKKEAEKKHK